MSEQRTITVEALAAALHHAMCDVSHHDAYTVCKNQRKYELIASATWNALPAEPAGAGLREADRLVIDGRAIHAAWRDGMLHQGRTVAAARLEWDTLSVEDRQLDDWIAYQLLAALAATPGGEEA